jgi:hypothetical protein
LETDFGPCFWFARESGRFGFFQRLIPFRLALNRNKSQKFTHFRAADFTLRIRDKSENGGYNLRFAAEKAAFYAEGGGAEWKEKKPKIGNIPAALKENRSKPGTLRRLAMGCS